MSLSLTHSIECPSSHTSEIQSHSSTAQSTHDLEYETNPHCSPFQEACTLLDLSAELRNEIYKLCLGGRTYRFKDAFACTQARLDGRGEKHILALIYTCRQIHSEASLLPYSLNTFSFREFNLSFNPFLDHRTLAQFRAITKVELVTFQAERMWAAPEVFPEYFKEFKTSQFLRRLSNLEKIRVIVDREEALYVKRGSSDRSFSHFHERQRKFKLAVNCWRRDVAVPFRDT